MGEFLRTRRERLLPSEVGLNDTGDGRRVRGLRRDEVARLAGVSVDYYVRLEQGRARNVSDSVLDAVARALSLDVDEQEHLHNLARPAEAPFRPAEPAVDGALQRLLACIRDVPALVLDRNMDVLDWNAVATVVFRLRRDEDSPPNAARMCFLDPRAAERYPNWPEIAEDTVAHLRLQAGRHPNDPTIECLVDELLEAREVFRRLWSNHNVRQRTTTRIEVIHPEAGELHFLNLWLSLPAWPDHTVIVYTVEGGSLTQQRLQRFLMLS